MSDNDNETLKRLIVFAIFMENGQGIMSKAPDYVMEKFNLATVGDSPEKHLDNANQMKLQEYFLQWGI